MSEVFTPKHLKGNSNLPFVHTITSKTTLNKEVLIITGYDYFLQKRDLKELLQKYAKIILVPRLVSDTYFLGAEVGKFIDNYNKVHLVNNPSYDTHHKVVYNLALAKSKVIRTTVVSEFCEETLKKLYIPELMEDKDSVDYSLTYFKLSTRIVKKAFDWGVGSILLVISSPLWLISTFIIRKQSPGKAFFRQKRVGIRDHEFACIKFRSMRTDAEVNGAQFASKNDDRVFPFGKIMRATRIDELPQLLNIVKGEMSLVGPRPERRIFTDAFEENLPYYRQRHVVKPGISGYAQVMYPYGSGLNDARHKLMYDLYYIKNWSLRLELTIVCRTVMTVLLKRGI